MAARPSPIRTEPRYTPPEAAPPAEAGVALETLRPRTAGAALIAAAAGIGALVGLVFAYVEPVSAPVIAPIVVLLAATGLWGASRVDQRRLRSEIGRLAVENRALAQRLESLADSAWELRESEERYRSLIDAQGGLVVHSDRAGTITFVNHAFTSAFGLATDDLVGQKLALRPLEERRDRSDSSDRLHDIESRDVKLQTVAGPRWFAWIDIRMRDENGALGPIYSVARDITVRKDVEQALVVARERAEAASRAKSRFLATVSHEFRTPLNGIIGLTALLRETGLTPDQETYARAVQSSGEALLTLIDDMLDFAKIEAGRLDLRPEPTEIEALLQDVAELLAGRSHAKGIDIAVSLGSGVPSLVSVDPTRLRQVLVNLAGNGVKFTEKGGVTLSASATPAADGTTQIRFAVADTGRGVAPEDAERIFGEFEQGDTALTRRHGGAGLGLAICRQLVRRMGGELTVTSAPGGGSVFAFTLALPTSDDRPSAASKTLAGRRMLVVMPDGAEPRAVVESLAAAAVEARAVATINEGAALIGAAAAAELPYDAILIDRRTMSEPASAIRLISAAGGRDLAAAVLIEPGARGEIDTLREAGFAAYLVRPIRRSSLLRIAGEIMVATEGFHADPADAPARRRERPDRTPATIDVLLAEDNEINALLARTVIEGLGHTVYEVRDGDAAVAAVEAEPERFALILMDLHMPILDGIAATQAIRALEKAGRWRPAAILAITADVLPETRSEAIAAGIDAVLEKPVSPQSLRRLIAELTSSASAR